MARGEIDGNGAHVVALEHALPNLDLDRTLQDFLPNGLVVAGAAVAIGHREPLLRPE
jgi:hypothetical protein